MGAGAVFPDERVLELRIGPLVDAVREVLAQRVPFTGG